MSPTRTLGISLATLLALTASAPAYGESSAVPPSEAAVQAAAQQDGAEDAAEAAAESSEAADDAAEAAYAPKKFPGYAYKIHFLKHMIARLHARKLELRELPRGSLHRQLALATKKESIEKYRARLHEVRMQLAERRLTRHAA